MVNRVAERLVERPISLEWVSERSRRIHVARFAQTLWYGAPCAAPLSKRRVILTQRPTVRVARTASPPIVATRRPRGEPRGEPRAFPRRTMRIVAQLLARRPRRAVRRSPPTAAFLVSAPVLAPPRSLIVGALPPTGA